MSDIQTIATVVIAMISGGNFIVGLMLSKQLAEVKNYINERFVSKSDLRDVVQILQSSRRIN